MLYIFNLSGKITTNIYDQFSPFKTADAKFCNEVMTGLIVPIDVEVGVGVGVVDDVE